MLIDQLPSPGRIVAISDCYLKRMNETMELKKKTWPCYQDYRQMFDKEHLDAVIVATPDHGRALACILACQAGLDIYAEKPLCVTIDEGQAMVKAARHYKRVFQVGSQQRTMEMNRYACDLVRSGKLGKITEVIAEDYPGRALSPTTSPKNRSPKATTGTPGSARRPSSNSTSNSNSPG